MRKEVYFVCFSIPERIMIVWKLALSIAHSLQFVAALIVAVLQHQCYTSIVTELPTQALFIFVYFKPLAVVEDCELSKELALDHH